MTNTTTPTRATAFAGVVVFGVQKTISMSRRYDNDWKKSPPIRCDLVNKLGYLPFCMTNNLANCAVGIGAATFVLSAASYNLVRMMGLFGWRIEAQTGELRPA